MINLLFFKKNARFSCVCAFFVVPLQRFLKSSKCDIVWM